MCRTAVLEELSVGIPVRSHCSDSWSIHYRNLWENALINHQKTRIVTHRQMLVGFPRKIDFFLNTAGLTLYQFIDESLEVIPVKIAGVKPG